MIHSDQGFHYTHPEFQQPVKEMVLLQSMSQRGNCLDNAPRGSSWVTLNDKEAESLAELHTCVMEYMDFYNNRRKQWI